MARGIRERFIITRLYKDERRVTLLFLIILGLVFILIANIAYLNLVSFNNLKAYYLGEKPLPNSTPTPAPTPVLTTEPTPTPILVQTEIYRNANQNSGPKEYFIAFGSGTNSSSDWQDVPGAEAVLDFGNYQNIKEVKFEASITVPTANQAVWVRLFNKTDQHPVWNSEVTMSGGASSYMVSSPIVYDKGSKTYQVQMKTQLKYTANLTQARLHIILN